MNKKNNFVLVTILLNCFLALAVSAQKNDTALGNAPKAVINVSTTNDVIDAGGGNCSTITIASLPGPDGQTSLREAVCAANNTTGADTITLPNGTYTLTRTGTGEDAAATGDLDITDSLTINGNGMNTTIINGNNTDRVFDLKSGINLTLNGLTVTNGNAASALYGGGIYNAGGTLTVTNSIISGNTANFYGGGIYSYGTAMLTNTTVSGNTASSGAGIYNESDSSVSLANSIVSGNNASESGGGIFNSPGGIAILTNSTVSGNKAIGANGGGIYNSTGTVTITNSTVSGNMATVNGGGIYNDGTSTLTLNLTSVTVAFNSAGNFGGGVFSSGTANLRNTIVAKNTGNTNSPDYGGAIASSSTFNLIGNGSGMSGITNGSGGNQVGTSGTPIDPQLDSTLALNGGTTPNHALLPSSPAIDKGSDTTNTTDQRGMMRPINLPSYPDAAGGNAADIGAFEVQTAPTAATVLINGYVTSNLGRGIIGIQITLTDSQGNTRTTSTTTGGYYRFEDVQVGETYIISATGKRFTFSQPVRVLNVDEETTEVNFIADSEKKLRIF